MGRIENKTYKNIFITPHKDTKTLVVYMNGKLLCGEVFRLEAAKQNVEDIAIICGELEQKEFNILINKIKSITEKTTFISINSNKNYKKCVEEYKYQYKRFPDNIFIRNILVEKNEEGNYILNSKNNRLIKKKSN